MVKSDSSIGAYDRKHRLSPVLLVALVYVLAGIIFGALAGSVNSNQARIFWRLIAWLISSIAFAAHIIYEQIRLHSSLRATALRVSLAAAAGAFGLAAAANLHSYRTGAGNRHLLALALVSWPVITGVPAFLVAFAVASCVKFIRRRY